MLMSVKIPSDIPKLDNIDIFYTDKEIESKFGLKSEKSCDYYGHYQNCSWFLIESKSRGKIREALVQIDNTIKALIKYEKKVDFIFIVADKLDKMDSNAYSTHEVSQLPFRLLVHKDTKKPVTDRRTGNVVYLIYRKTMNHVNQVFQQKSMEEFFKNGTIN